nr:PREDICTED: regulator of cell cycle RGCC-like [Latimeria chalumnae]|eukprot:XP_005992951.1 PREDICTED: regulator of cell cycle RGCC-like [Latimeria chalumnae]
MASDKKGNTVQILDELDDLLQEFDTVVQDFHSPIEKRHFQYDEHLEKLKRKNVSSISDNGVEEFDSGRSSPGSSLNSSEESLNTITLQPAPKAKLGDTRELGEFIADLMDTLAEM